MLIRDVYLAPFSRMSKALLWYCSDIYELCVAHPEPLSDKLYNATKTFLESHVSEKLAVSYLLRQTFSNILWTICSFVWVLSNAMLNHLWKKPCFVFFFSLRCFWEEERYGVRRSWETVIHCMLFGSLHRLCFSSVSVDLSFCLDFTSLILTRL